MGAFLHNESNPLWVGRLNIHCLGARIGLAGDNPVLLYKGTQIIFPVQLVVCRSISIKYPCTSDSVNKYQLDFIQVMQYYINHLNTAQVQAFLYLEYMLTSGPVFLANPYSSNHASRDISLTRSVSDLSKEFGQ